MTKTTAPNQLWQTDFTYLKFVGWGWMYLLIILDDYSRYVIAWQFCTMTLTKNVTDTLNLALEASGCALARLQQKPRLLSSTITTTAGTMRASVMLHPPIIISYSHREFCVSGSQ